MIRDAWGFLLLIFVIMPASVFAEFGFFIGGKSFRRSVRPQLVAFHVKRSIERKPLPTKPRPQQRTRKPRKKKRNRKR